MPIRKKILFVCVENAGRSQMAEGFLRKYGRRFEAISAGTAPSHILNPMVIDVMGEIGVDITNQEPKMLSNDMVMNSAKAVNMGCMDKESCPSLFVGDVLNWNIPDPKGKTIDEVRAIRDQIESKVLALIKTLEDDL